jgi:5-methylcytosine-specific restriction endonuclease McrBC regulatory subunit McrC
MASQTRTGEDRFRLRPDIVVRRRNDPLIVIDAKWKRLDNANLADGVVDADIRQVFAYAKVFRTGRAALIYPAAGAEPRRESFRTKEAEGFVDIDVLEVPMRDDQLSELDQCLRQLIAEVETDLPGDRHSPQGRDPPYGPVFHGLARRPARR